MRKQLTDLRRRMVQEKIDAYLIPSDDFHGSEYVGDHFKCRGYVSGFTGSAGTLLVTADWAGLWTDGRYFLQAAQQLDGSGITLCKMGEKNVPTEEAYLKETLRPGQCLGFDGRTVTAKRFHALETALDGLDITFRTDVDLAGDGGRTGRRYPPPQPGHWTKPTAAAPGGKAGTDPPPFIGTEGRCPAAFFSG